MNFSVFLSRACWRTATNPGDTTHRLDRGPLCVGAVRDSPLFSLAPALPSKTSSGWPGLPSFGSFIGTIFGVWGGFRLLRSVHIQLRLLAFLDRAARRSQNGGLRSLKIGFSCLWFPPLIEGGRAGLFDYVGPRPASRLSADSGSAFPFTQQGQHPQISFSELNPPSPSFPLFTLRSLPLDSQRKTRGQNGFAIPFL